MSRGFASRDANEAKLEALIETMYLAARADGELTVEERAHFVSSVQSLTERRLEGDKLDQFLDRFQSEYQKNGLKRRLAAVKARLGDQRACKLGLSMAIRMPPAGDTRHS